MDIWKHGTYVDLWSSVHFLSGFVLAGGFFKYGYDFSHALSVSIVLLLLWEVFEWTTKIIEPSINVLMDIFIGLAGFFGGAYLFYTQGVDLIYLYVGLVLTIGMSLWGFIDFKVRGYR